MHHRSNSTPWLALRTALAGLPDNPPLLLGALAATLLAALMTLAPPPEERPGLREVRPLAAPAGVFRAPHPSSLPPGWRAER